MLNPYEKDRQASIKDFKYRFKKNPCEYFKVGALFSACLVLSWQVHPAICLVPSLLMGGLVYVDLFAGTTSGIRRRHDHAAIAFDHILHANFSAFATHISKNHYEETDYETLKQQNTLYLSDILDKYDQGHHSDRRTYIQAAEILLAHHANTESVLQWLPPTHKGRQWLELHLANRKAKLP